MKFGAVVIGRNEATRLGRCLSSLPGKIEAIYVDSGSTDGSDEVALRHQAKVIALDATKPFTAARARNAGLSVIRERDPTLSYVQFVDGDCELDRDWPLGAASFLDAHGDVGVVTGRLRERNPQKSIYNWLCDREWDGPSGEVKACGGVAMMRISALQSVGGFSDVLVAGEEPELCFRLRANGWRIWRLQSEMALHDADIMGFGQWLRRTIRAGYAFAQGAHMHGGSPERHFVWESRRAWLWGIWLPLGGIAAGTVFGPAGWAIFLTYPLQLLRQIFRNAGSFRERALLALFQTVARFPESWGQLKFMRDHLLGRTSRIIEYK